MHIDPLYSPLHYLRSWLLGPSGWVVVHTRSSGIFLLSSPRWNGRQASAQNREFVTCGSLVWPWLRFLHNTTISHDDGQAPLDWERALGPLDHPDCYLGILFQHIRGVLHWRLILRTFQWGDRWFHRHYRTLPGCRLCWKRHLPRYYRPAPLWSTHL